MAASCGLGWFEAEPPDDGNAQEAAVAGGLAIGSSRPTREVHGRGLLRPLLFLTLRGAYCAEGRKRLGPQTQLSDGPGLERPLRTREGLTLAHDPRLTKNEDQIEELRKTIPNWIIHLQRAAAPAIVPRFGPLEGPG